MAIKNQFLIINPLLPFNFPPSGSPEDFNQPVTVTFSSSKQIDQRRTVGGWNYTHWGDNPDQLTAKGSILIQPGKESVALLTLLIMKQLYRLDKKRLDGLLSLIARGAGAVGMASKSFGGGSSASTLGFALGLLSLPSIKSKLGLGTSDLSYSFIFFDYNLYGGHFTKFDYTRDANRPRFIDYTFNFTITWSADNLLTDSFYALSKSISSSLGMVTSITPKF